MKYILLALTFIVVLSVAVGSVALAHRQTKEALRLHHEALELANHAIAEQHKSNDSLRRCVDYLELKNGEQNESTMHVPNNRFYGAIGDGKR